MRIPNTTIFKIATLALGVATLGVVTALGRLLYLLELFSFNNPLC